MARKDSYWQDVYVDSRKVSTSEALREFNQTLRSARSNFRAVAAKRWPRGKGAWHGKQYLRPFKVKVVRTDGVLD